MENIKIVDVPGLYALDVEQNLGDGVKAYIPGAAFINCLVGVGALHYNGRVKIDTGEFYTYVSEHTGVVYLHPVTDLQQ